MIVSKVPAIPILGQWPLHSLTGPALCWISTTTYCIYSYQLVYQYPGWEAILKRALKEPRRAFLSFFFLVDCLNEITYFFFLSKSYTISSIYILAAGNAPCGKPHTSRTISVTPLQSILEESLYLGQSFWYYWQINSTHSSTRKAPQRLTLQIKLRQCEKVRVLALPMLFKVDRRLQIQPFPSRPMPASNGP